jgi:hypothetical protein
MDRFGQQPELSFQFRLAAREPGLQEGKGVFPRTGGLIVQRVAFGSLEFGVNDQHLIGFANRDGRRRRRQFPAESVGGGEPHLAAGGERL